MEDIGNFFHTKMTKAINEILYLMAKNNDPDYYKAFLLKAYVINNIRKTQ